MPGSTLEAKVKVTDDAHPFGLPWLDSCYQETLLPTGPWINVEKSLCDSLAKRIEKQFNYPGRKQMIFELMGLDFIKTYFPKEDYDPLVLEPPILSKEDRKKLQIDAQNWLQGAITKVAKETGTMRPVVAEEQGETISADTAEFLAHTKMVFTKGMDRHLLLLEKEIQKDHELDAWEKEQQKEASREARDRIRERQRLVQERQRLYGDISTPGPRSILKNADEGLQTRLTTASTVASRPVTANVKGAQFQATADPPRFWSMQSDSLGRSLVAILKRDPRRMAEVTRKLHGRQLPGVLRHYIWTDMLLKYERDQHADVNTETLVRERFVRAVRTGMTELKVKKATQSPIQRLIENAVVEIYDNTAGMAEYRNDTLYMKETVKALNVLYTYDRSYEPYLVHWLFPLQLCYQDGVGLSEHVYELAMYLDLLNKTLFPKWPEIFATAERVMQRLADSDPDLHDHLKAISQRDVTVNPKEFLVQLIHQEMSEAEVLLKQGSALPPSNPNARVLAEPLIFLRKWIGEGFVGVLDSQAALFIWDQCFLQKWHLKVMEDTCLALLLLLRHKFKAAHNYITMKEVFLTQPSMVYTADLQKAWLHLQLNGPFKDVPPMNRLTPKPSEETPDAYSVYSPYSPYGTRDGSPVTRRPSPSPSTFSVAPLEPFMLGNVRLTLKISAGTIQEEKWLNDLRMDKLRLESHVYFGDIKVQTGKAEKTPRVVERVSESTYGDLEYKIEYSRDEMLFRDIDVGGFDLEMEMGGHPYAIVELKYAKSSKEEVPLGWARVKLFQRRDELEEEGVHPPGSQVWILMARDKFYPLYSGPPLEKFAGESDSPLGNADSPGRRSIDTLFLEKYAELLADGSQLGLHIYNPNRHIPRAAAPSRAKSRRVSETPAPHTPAIPVPPPDVRPPPKKATPQTRSPKGLSITDTFDVYIDMVANLPDNASIVKVTGRLVKPGELKDHKDLLALPELKSSARNPTFAYHYTVNRDRVRADPDLILLLRVYTVDVDTKELVVVGSCFYETFDDQQILKLGPHVRQIHSGLPDIKQGVKALNHNSLDKGPRIPACLIYFRLERSGGSHKKPPAWPEFRVEDPPFNSSEQKVIDSYRRTKGGVKTVDVVIKERQAAENVSDAEKKLAPLRWLQERLDQKKQLPPNQPADDLDLNRLVRYRQHVGFNVNVHGAYGFPEGVYYQCHASVLPGKDAVKAPATKESLCSLKHDWKSLQTAPQWLDTHKNWQPTLDQYSVILVQIFQYDLSYTPTKNNKNVGKVTSKGKALSVSENDLFGWCVVPLFEKDYVLSGTHHVPIFKGKPSQQILQDFRNTLPEAIIGAKPWAKSLHVDGAALVVEVWDAHFKIKDIPGEIQRTDFLLDILGKRDTYTKNEQATKGKIMNELVLKHLDKKHQNTKSEVYNTERGFFQEAVETAYSTAMETAMKSGKVGVA